MFILKLGIKYFLFTIFPLIVFIIYKIFLEIEFQLLQDFLAELIGLLILFLLFMCYLWKSHFEDNYSEFSKENLEKRLSTLLRKLPKPMFWLLRIASIIIIAYPFFYVIWQKYINENDDDPFFIFLDFTRNALGISNEFFAMYLTGVLICCFGIVFYVIMEKTEGD